MDPMSARRLARLRGIFLFSAVALVALISLSPTQPLDAGPFDRLLPGRKNASKAETGEESVAPKGAATPATTTSRKPANDDATIDRHGDYPGANAPGAAVVPAAPLPASGGYHSYHGNLSAEDQNAIRSKQRYHDADPYPYPPGYQDLRLLEQTAEQAMAKSTGCIHCHKGVGDPHGKKTLKIGCTDCHGGNADTTKYEDAHVHPIHRQAWTSSANPVRSYTLLNHESPEFVRFVNPGDNRVSHISCGTAGCHPDVVLQVRKSMMTHGAMLWGAAMYNNGSIRDKWPKYGEAYSMHGTPIRLQTVPAPTAEEMARGVLPYLDPLPRFEVSQPGNVLRIFERGGRFRSEIGVPERFEEPGKPRERLSIRGLGTQNRTDPVIIGLNKTRLFDPTLNFLGTNDHPGDYRSSGCTACHVIYANDRSPVHSGPYAEFGNRGYTSPDNPDPTIPKYHSGHPIAHQFTSGIPSSQCMVCHIHPGTTVMNSFFGYMWWDLETDGELMYPKKQVTLTPEQLTAAQHNDPNDATARGLWQDPEFLAESVQLNSETKHTQFADFHGHGWMFRAVFKTDHKGNYLDSKGDIIPLVDNQRLQKAVAPPTKAERDAGLAKEGKADVPVHMLDIHLERGMHCIDCHFSQDMHGDTKLYGEVRAACEIQCVDCHGSYAERATLYTSGPAARAPIEAGQPRGRDLTRLKTPFGRPRFERVGEKIIQNSMVNKGVSWVVTQTVDTITPGKAEYNALSHLSKTVRHGDNGKLVWGRNDQDEQACAHATSNMNCIACHSGWNPSCYGCHLPQRANKKTPMLHWEGDVTRNYVSYNFQTLRDEVYMLARDGNATGNRIGPSRSSCAIHVGSYNGNRESIYVQQQTISGEGLSGIAFSTNVPHTVRGSGVHEQKYCTDCHLSKNNDNNALIAQLTMQGTGFMNFIGKYTWMAAGDHGFFGVVVTETEEPQCVIGSSMHKIVWPEHYKQHVEHGRDLRYSHEHPGKDIVDNVINPFRGVKILDVQNRGEYLYAACGEGGLKVFDIAFIDHKGFAERITTAPVSPWGQRFFVPTKFATSVSAPVTTAPDPTRKHFPENHEPSVHMLNAYLYVTDLYEGLILVGAATTIDGNPLNNFLKRELTFNPEGLLNGARGVAIVGTHAYVSCDAGVVVLDINTPLEPKVTAVIGTPVTSKPVAVAAQFRYAFVCDCLGLLVLDITDNAHPVPVARLPLPEARNVYLSRTYAYVSGGKKGMIIVDITNPEKPFVEQAYDAHGAMTDVHDIQLGITYNSLFAYVADGKNGMRVVQLTSPNIQGNSGFSPRPVPFLVATYPLEHGGEALAIARGVDRDRAVDEAGNQTSVFGRVGARPFNLQEMQQLYLHPKTKQIYRVSDNPFDTEIYDYDGPPLPAGGPVESTGRSDP